MPLGIFLYPTFEEEEVPVLFAPRCMGRSKLTAAMLQSFVAMARRFQTIHDYCNGPLFLLDQVVNPAVEEDDYSVYHLLSDPWVSPQHFEVIGIQELDAYNRYAMEEGSEWPPSPCFLWVYSSAMGRWEETAFEWEAGGPASTFTEVKSANDDALCHRAVYYHGAFCLYILYIAKEIIS